MIGPDLPPHLRKRAASAEETADAEDSDGEYGPALPPGKTAEVAATNGSDQVDDDDDDEEAYGPAPPPGARPSASPSSVHAAAGASDELEADDDDDDEEVYGPQAPAARGSAQPLNEAAQWDQLRAEDEVLAKTRRANADMEDGRKREREEWMLIPPEAKASGSGNKFRARAAQATDMSWAKTPGKGVPAVASRAESRAPARKEAEADDETERNIQAFDELRRHQKPLMEVHKGQKQKRSGSEAQPRTGPLVWDRERDLVDNRKQVDAKDYMKTVGKLNDRFSGTSRKFL